MDVKEMVQLAEEFGLPCIERENSISVIGLELIMEFKLELNHVKLEETLI